MGMRQNSNSDRTRGRALEGYLAAASIAGDRRAMDQLVKVLSTELLAHAARLLGDREMARDALQVAWIDIFSGLKSLRDVSSVSSFAYRIVTRKTGRHIGSTQKERAMSDELSAGAIDQNDPIEDRLLTIKAVRDAIDQLSAPHRATLALFYLEQMSVAEVAVALD